MIKAARFYVQPMRCLFTGPVGPLHHLKSLVLFHLSNEAPIIPPAIVSWKTCLLHRDIGYTVVIDTPMQYVMEINAILAKSKFTALLGWDHARRSPAHSPTAPRQLICGFFDIDRVCLMDLALIVKALQGLIQHEGV